MNVYMDGGRSAGKTTLWRVLESSHSPKELIENLRKIGFRLVGTGVPSPVGEVPYGSPVLTTYKGRRAVWILGRLYQQQFQTTEETEGIGDKDDENDLV